MASQKITYEDKDKSNVDGIHNRWRDSDANMVKEVVNDNAIEYGEESQIPVTNTTSSNFNFSAEFIWNAVKRLFIAAQNTVVSNSSWSAIFGENHTIGGLFNDGLVAGEEHSSTANASNNNLLGRRNKLTGTGNKHFNTLIGDTNEIEVTGAGTSVSNFISGSNNKISNSNNCAIVGNNITLSNEDSLAAFNNLLISSLTNVYLGTDANGKVIDIGNPITILRDGVLSAGDTLAKLYTLIQAITGIAPPEAFSAAGGAFPTTFGGQPIKGGQSFRITDTGTLGSSNPKSVGPEDLLIALVNNPTNNGNDWEIVEGNRNVGTATVLGLTKLYTNILASNTDGAITQAAAATAITAAQTNAINTIRDSVVSAGDTLAKLYALIGQLPPKGFIVACSDEITPLTTGASKVSFRMPYAMTLTSIKASLVTAQASGSTFTVDVNKNGVSIFSTRITIDNTRTTSKTSYVQPVISTTSFADDDEITIDIDQVGNGTAKGLKVTFTGV